MNCRVGFMQGRLSPVVGGRIQCFPWEHWRDEFALAERHGFALMEWTLDQDRLYENPLLTESGQQEIRTLCGRHGVAVRTLTGDCFMQAPLWKAKGSERAGLERDFDAVAGACSAVGIAMIVVPLVDGGRMESRLQEDAVVEFLQASAPMLRARGVRVIFECDFPPAELARFIDRLDVDLFGINYDIGNSAALGYAPEDEFRAYGHRIVNVHVKDRVLGGTTVPLGTGNARFDAVFGALGRAKYAGNYVLQTARAADGDHAGVLTRYRDMTAEWISRHGA